MSDIGEAILISMLALINLTLIINLSIIVLELKKLNRK